MNRQHTHSTLWVGTDRRAVRYFVAECIGSPGGHALPMEFTTLS